jgi:hypothetical protein
VRPNPRTGERTAWRSVDPTDVVVQPAASAFDTLVGGLARTRTSMDEAASAIVRDPFDVDAIVSLDVAALAMTGMARALQVVAETHESLFDALA